MYQEIQISVRPSESGDESVLRFLAARKMGLDVRRIQRIDTVRRSIDARRREVVLNLVIGVHVDRIETPEPVFIPAYKEVGQGKAVVIVGAGPAGLFAALRLIERGLKPVILERGKSVEERKKELKRLYATGVVDEDSNFGFGEGGAGTFSDGKLYTRSGKRGNVRRALEILVYHGGDPAILVDAHPHVGTDMLPVVIANIRKTIERHGGEIHFNTRVTDILIRDHRVCGVVAGLREYYADSVILATGHSARDVYRMLYHRSVALEAKDFAVGLRLEHSQFDIDCMQYHSKEGRGAWLPAAEYSFVTNVGGRGVYTFCMCPGGVIVPAATAPGQQVVNGMSSSFRNSVWANSAVVTAIGKSELKCMDYHGLFAGMEFQEDLERRAWEEGGGGLCAPAQVLTDFLSGRLSENLPATSYRPGVKSSMMSAWLPPVLYDRLAAGLTCFGRKAPGFMTRKALLLGVETRTSSPLRIPRREDMMHTEIRGLYPCGEGAGYAGGIISSAMDGEKCAGHLIP